MGQNMAGNNDSEHITQKLHWTAAGGKKETKAQLDITEFSVWRRK